jgi:hypothetical protein
MSDNLEIKIFRLNSGEEIVAEGKEGEETYTLIRPALILPGGQGQIMLAPYMPYAEQENGIEFPKRSFLFIVSPHESLLNEYNDYFGKNAGKPKIWQPDNKLVGVSPTSMPSSSSDGPVSGSSKKLKLTP